nr:putative ribonuclease H-like domain-containing protein [Tanacetum cinerariifolium]
MNKECDLEDTPVNDRYAEGMHAVPPPMIGNYMPSRPDVEIDYSKFNYGPKQTSADELDSKPIEYASRESNSSIETTTSMPAPVDNAPKIICKPKVWTDAPIIKEYKSDSDYDSVSNVQDNIEKPSFAFTDSDDPHKALKDKEMVDKFKNYELIEFCGLKGIKREYSNARTPQQYRVTKRKNKTLIEAARTMLAESFLPTTFWAEAVNTVGYVLNRPFGCHVTILNTIDHLGKFDGKSDLGFLVRYSLNSKDFKVYNLETKRVEENLHVNFLENKPNVARKGHAWMFDLDYLTDSMNYKPISVENQANKSIGPKEANNSAGTEANNDQGANSEEIDLHDKHFVLPICTNLLNAVSTPISTAGPLIALNNGEPLYPNDPSMLHLEDIYASPSEGIFSESSYDDEGVVTKFNNLETTMTISLTLTTKIHTIHPKIQILKDPLSTVLTRSKVHKNFEAHAVISQALEDESWVDAMQEELLQFQIQKVWILVDLPCGKKAIGTKWVYRNKKDERGVVVRNKVKQKEDGIFISQDKYVVEILKKFDFLSVKTASTPIKTQKPLVKDEEAADVDVHLYRSMIGSPMYLTASRPHIMFAVCISKANQNWYLKVSSFDLEAYSDSDYAGANLDRKSTTGGCQILGRRLISWQCKKQTIVATSTIEAKYVAAAHCLDDLSSYTTKYTSPALTQKVFGNMRRIGKRFSGLETPLFATMLVQPQAATEEEDKEDEVHAATTPPSPTHEPKPPS